MNRITPTFVAVLAFAVAAGSLVVLWHSCASEPAVDADGRVAAKPASALPGERPPAKSAVDAVPGATLLEPGGVGAQLLASLGRALAAGGVRENEAVLTFKDDDALRRFLERARGAGVTVLDRIDRLRSLRVRFGDLTGLRDEVLENASDYSAVNANHLFGVPFPPAPEDRAPVEHEPFRNGTLAFLGAPDDRSAWGRGVTIAVLDTGVAGDATFGVGRVNALDIGFGIGPGSASAKEAGHGTAVAALAAGGSTDAPGVAPAANILSIRVTDSSGTSDIFTLSRAIVTAVDAGAKVVNISLGGYSTGPVLDAAITYAMSQGAIIVAAAGNDQAAQLTWPAADRRVVSVGAVDAVGQQVTFSNSSPALQLTAPGYGVQTAWLDGQRVFMDGTSASAPLVTGAIAAMLSQNPSLTPQQAVALLTSAASEAGEPGDDAAFGRGILNLGWAMNISNASYVDTAVASHHFDATNNQMQIVVENRSGRIMSGMTLNASIAGANLKFTVPSLSPGETFVARAPTDSGALKNLGRIRVTTELTNPPGVTDQVPANNKRSSVLTPAGKR